MAGRLRGITVPENPCAASHSNLISAGGYPATRQLANSSASSMPETSGNRDAADSSKTESGLPAARSVRRCFSSP